MFPEEFEEDNIDPYFLDDFPDNYAHLSEQAKKTLKNTNNHFQLFYFKYNPLLITFSKRIKSTPFSIYIFTFYCTNDLIVTKDDSGKNIIIFKDLYIMSNLMYHHCSNLKNKNKISGRMSGIGFQGGYEKGKTAGERCSCFISCSLSENIPLHQEHIPSKKNLKSSQIELDTTLQKNFLI
ncbi:hypothetical protein VP01_3641g3 [Puccinia sorghi]|uniref:Uncharacterized protein n=1 Tax=Puccinia sorghi TaxID=27349 RepID=A0A0L6UUL6_9BASI|nr:hypothetical protein VP01_3641g3 [Puccinia sorghi]